MMREGLFKFRGRLLPLLLVPPALLAGCATDSGGLAQTRARPTPSVNRTAVATPTPAARTEREYGEHVAALRRLLPSRDFAIVVERPFVVVGDGGREAVESSARDTVKWAVDLLKRDYFTKDPEDILDVWLFKDAESYEKHRAALFGPGPDTPYGYYSARHKALVMNIATGGGTLVHEIVHPFVAANFPDCPAWFNEGLGSLYEQSGERDGHIVGYTNWRLPGLQKAISERRVRTFKELTALSADDFYSKETGTNYAQARYLCYYLQERGLLTRFYREFLANRAADPTGFDTLKKVLSIEDADAFQKDWEKFVLGLSEEIRLTPLRP
ncbi:MAG TPA: DUF1570 domain-containing protein [Pyrinomonadaceae bacterium]|jgi:hypothetical protein|nr:DUF1570 domain-containing protein [Pyrinomonadaceae bacterium]